MTHLGGDTPRTPSHTTLCRHLLVQRVGASTHGCHAFPCVLTAADVKLGCAHTCSRRYLTSQRRVYTSCRTCFAACHTLPLSHITRWMSTGRRIGRCAPSHMSPRGITRAHVPPHTAGTVPRRLTNCPYLPAAAKGPDCGWTGRRFAKPHARPAAVHSASGRTSTCSTPISVIDATTPRHRRSNDRLTSTHGTASPSTHRC